MNLAERLRQDMVAALKGKQELRLSTLRMALAAVKYKEVERRASLDDAGIMQVLATLIKQREDSAEQFTAGGRPELAAKERGEIAILNEYLPQLVSDADIEAAVRQAIAATGATSAKDMGAVMKAAMAHFAAAGQRADGKAVNAAVRRLLG
jgi:uncharacterized protein YqeY